MLLHAILHWPDEVALDLWPFALDHAIYLWNHLPNDHTGIAPVEIFTGQVFDDFDFLKSIQVFGCPCYVLDPKLQDGKKLPKWAPHSCQGQYLGLSTDHSSTIGRIRNLITGYISPQFHVVYDPFFTTVPTAGDPELADVDCVNLDALLALGNGHREFNQVKEIDELGNIEPAPELAPEWLTFREREVRQRRREQLAPLPGIRVRRRHRHLAPPAARENAAENAEENIPAVGAPNEEQDDEQEQDNGLDVNLDDTIGDYFVPQETTDVEDNDYGSDDVPEGASTGDEDDDDDGDEPAPLLCRS
jgi:hypothetical protein